MQVLFLMTNKVMASLNSQPLFGSCPGSMARGNEPKSVWEFRPGNGNNDELFAFVLFGFTMRHIATMCFSDYTSDYVILPNCWQKPCALWL